MMVILIVVAAPVAVSETHVPSRSALEIHGRLCSSESRTNEHDAPG